jgi:hypothetical protein
MDLAVQESPGRQHHGARAELDADLRDGAHHAVALDHQVIDGLLEKPQIGLVLQLAANRCLIKNAVGLRPGGAHGRALGAVQDAELDAAFVGGQRHCAAHGVDFLDQVALADPADRRVAAHLAQGLDVVGQQQSLAVHARRGQCGLGAGMAATDHDHVKFLRVKHIHLSAPGKSGRYQFRFEAHGLRRQCLPAIRRHKQIDPRSLGRADMQGIHGA